MDYCIVYFGIAFPIEEEPHHGLASLLLSLQNIFSLEIDCIPICDLTCLRPNMFASVQQSRTNKDIAKTLETSFTLIRAHGPHRNTYQASNS